MNANALNEVGGRARTPVHLWIVAVLSLLWRLRPTCDLTTVLPFVSPTHEITSAYSQKTMSPTYHTTLHALYTHTPFPSKFKI